MAASEDTFSWGQRFLPLAAVELVRAPRGGLPRGLTIASDRSDGKIAHLDGLNLSRAWCFRALASALPSGDPRCAVTQSAADAHLAVSWPHLASDYMGEHWLSSFALLAIDEV